MMKKMKRLFVILTLTMLAAVCAAALFPMHAEAYAASGKIKAPVIKTLTKSDNGFTITSNKNKKADGYQIKYSTSRLFVKGKNKRVEGKKLSVTVSGLKEYKKYYVKIRIYRTVNGKKQYSKWSKVKKVKTGSKPFDPYYAYTKYHQTTLYKKRSVLSSSIKVWYNTKLRVTGIRKITGVRWVRVIYRGKVYYFPAESVSKKLKKEESLYEYTGSTELENEILQKAMEVYLKPTKYDNTHKAAVGVPDSSGRYPFDCSSLVSYILNSIMQQYCPAYNASRGVIDEYYTNSLINADYETSFKAVTVCTGEPVLSKLRAGDVLFFRQAGGNPVDHVGIYLGDGEFMQSNTIYTRYPGDEFGGVNIAPLLGKYKTEFIAARRFIPESASDIETLGKVLVRKKSVTVYSDVRCTDGKEIFIIEPPEGVKEMEIPVLYIGNRYYNDKEVSLRSAYVEYVDETGEPGYGFVRLSSSSVIRDPQPPEEPDLPVNPPEEQDGNDGND